MTIQPYVWTNLLRIAHGFSVASVSATVLPTLCEMPQLYSRVLVLSLLSVFLRGVAARSSSALERARNLRPPIVESATKGETEHLEWWEQHASLLREAWKEWESTDAVAAEVLQDDALTLDNMTVASLIDENLRAAVENAWENPSLENEAAVTDLWSEVGPGIYTCPFFTSDGVRRIRAHLDAAEKSGIPWRRPNGMNRFGMVVHPPDSVDGAVRLDQFTRFYEALIDTYIRPIMRTLFPEYAGDPKGDSESYAFTIQYSEDTDMELREHADASLFTLNVNLNLPHETYAGSDLHFVSPNGDSPTNIALQSGVAVVHLGQIRHQAHPIASGTRYNMIIWLFGQHGDVRIAPYASAEQMSVRQRWSSTHELVEPWKSDVSDPMKTNEWGRDEIKSEL